MRIGAVMKHQTQNNPSLVLILVGICYPIVFWIILIISGFLHPHYDPISQSISYLALGTTGWLQTANMFVFGLAIICFGTALYQNIRPSKGSRVVMVLFVLMGLGDIISGLFQADYPPTKSISFHALIHQAGASIAAIAFPINAYVLRNIFRWEPNWENLSNYTLITGAVVLALELGREILLPTNWLDSWFGLYERIIIIISLAWIEVISVRLLRIYRLRNTANDRKK